MSTAKKKPVKVTAAKNIAGAIKNMHKSGMTRAKIKQVLGVTDDVIQKALGKSTRGRKTSTPEPATEVKEPKVTKPKAAVKDKLILDYLVLDRSGSMGGERIRRATEGITKYVEAMAVKQKQTGIEARFNLIEFETRVLPVKYRSVNPIDPLKLENNTYSSTALFDGIAKAIALATEDVEANKDREVFVTITSFTDGEENCSTISGDNLRKLVKEAEAKGWIVAYVGDGTKEQVARMASKVGVSANNTAAYNASDVKQFSTTMSKMSMSRSATTDAIAANKFTNTSYFTED